MNSKRGFKRVTIVLAGLAGVICMFISGALVADKHHSELRELRFRQTLLSDEYVEYDKAAEYAEYDKAAVGKLERGFWVRLSKPSLVALCIAGGLGGALAGFCTTWLILWFSGLAIYKLIKWLILGFCDDVSSKQVESMEAG